MEGARMEKVIADLEIRLQDETKRYELENKQLQTRIDDLAKQANDLLTDRKKRDEELTYLHVEIASFHALFMNLPVPMWRKDKQARMVSYNDAYIHKLLVPSGIDHTNYNGLNDIEFWGEELGKTYYENSMWVIKNGKMMDTLELVPTRHGTREFWRVIKMPLVLGGVWSMGGYICGEIGLALPMHAPDVGLREHT